MALTKVSYSIIQGAPANVMDFGAKGDGTTDDTVAIQNAINQAATIGRDVVFDKLTYLISTLTPKSNVTLQLNGATLKLKNGTNERIFNGDAGGVNFAVVNGTLDGNKANNTSGNLSGGSNYTNWDGLTIRNIIFKNIRRVSLILDGTTKNVVIENISNIDSGIGNTGYALEAYYGVTKLKINNFSVTNMQGYGIHFIGCSDFVAENLFFDNLNDGTSTGIAITWTEANRGIVKNITCNNVTGDSLECNNSTDILIENVKITNSGRYGILMGDNAGLGTYNQRIAWKNVVTTNTGGTYSVSVNYFKNCTFEKFNTDKTWTTVSGLDDRNNVIQDSIISANIDGTFTLYRKFGLKRVRFNNFYINDFDGVVATFSNPQINGSFNLSLANGATTYIDFNAFNSMGQIGFVNGRLRVTAGLNNVQGTYHECLFLGSNDNTTFNLSAITTVVNLIARTMTITADAANRRIAITNSTGAGVTVWWAIELHNADY
jgi:hypothetical protein